MRSCAAATRTMRPGRKTDPSFDMKPFRMNVAAIMAGAAPAISMIPPSDGAGRKTLRRGNAGADVKSLQSKLGIDPSGAFDGATEAAVRRFQSAHALVADGIVGPRTFAAFGS